MFNAGKGLPKLHDLLGIRIPGPEKGPPKVPKHPPPPTPSGPGCDTGPDLGAVISGKKKRKR